MLIWCSVTLDADSSGHGGPAHGREGVGAAALHEHCAQEAVAVRASPSTQRCHYCRVLRAVVKSNKIVHGKNPLQQCASVLQKQVIHTSALSTLQLGDKNSVS
jgi:hypothetical protein